MNKAAIVQARIDAKLKQQADFILHSLGLSASQAINALYAQIVLQQGIPFELKIPNNITLQAIHELENGGGKTFSSFQEMTEDLDREDA